MKVEIISDDLINVFINNFYFKDIDFSKKIEIISIIKDLLNKIEIRYSLNFNGFYKINVYPNDKVGVFLNIIKIDDNEFSLGADYRITICQDKNFYLETENYEEIPKNIEKRYYKDKYYININDISDIAKYIDFGTILYGDDVRNMLSNSKILR